MFSLLVTVTATKRPLKKITYYRFNIYVYKTKSHIHLSHTLENVLACMLHVCVLLMRARVAVCVYTAGRIELEVLVAIYHSCYLIFSSSLLGQKDRCSLCLCYM